MSELNMVHELLRLVNVMKLLRGPSGCAWDAGQTSRSLRPYLLEETHELLEALDLGREQDICEELGDLLLQIVFHAQLFDEQQIFDLGDVARGIADKLVRRHPHVFGMSGPDQSADALRRSWEAIKLSEKAAGGVTPRQRVSLPEGLPALQRAQSIQSRRLRGDTSSDASPQLLADLEESVAGLIEQVRSGETGIDLLEELLARVLSDTTALAHQLGIDSESALRSRCHELDDPP